MISHVKPALAFHVVRLRFLSESAMATSGFTASLELSGMSTSAVSPEIGIGG